MSALLFLSSRRPGKIVLPFRGLGYLFEGDVSFVEERLHIAAKDQDFSEKPETGQWRGEAEDVFHFSFAGRDRAKEVIVGHGPERAMDHRVLEVGGWFHRCNFAGKGLPESEVLRAPGDSLV